jgi:hypothetical protein
MQSQTNFSGLTLYLVGTLPVPSSFSRGVNILPSLVEIANRGKISMLARFWQGATYAITNLHGFFRMLYYESQRFGLSSLATSPSNNTLDAIHLGCDHSDSATRPILR